MSNMLSYFHNTSPCTIKATTFQEEFSKTAAKFPDRECFICYDKNQTRHSITYSQLDQQSTNLAKALRSLGYGKQTSIAMLLRNSVPFAVIQFSLHKVGSPAILLKTEMAVDEMMNDLECEALFTDLPLRKTNTNEVDFNSADTSNIILMHRPPLQKAIVYDLKDLMNNGSTINNTTNFEQISLDDVAIIIFTSGSTGKPKAVPLRHIYINTILTGVQVKSGMRMYQEREMSSSSAVSLTVLSYCGTPVVTVDNKNCSPKSNLPLTLKVLQREKCQTAMLMGYVLYDIITSSVKVDLPDIKLIFTSGQMLSKPLVIKLKEKLPNILIVNAYAMTECNLIASGNPLDLDQPKNAIGKVRPYSECKVINEDGDMVPYNDIGEICIRGYTVFTGYLDTAHRGIKLPNKWFHTGDLGFLNQDGYIGIIGRKDDMIKNGVDKVAPIVIEEILSSHPDVHICAVVGVPDKRMGQEVCACIQVEEKHHKTAEDFHNWWTSENESGRIPQGIPKPKYFWLINKVPTNASNKIDRKQLQILAAQYIKN